MTNQTLYTTFNWLKDYNACTHRYRILAEALGGVSNYGQDAPIPLVKILETNGYEDCVFAFQSIPYYEPVGTERTRIFLLFGADCLERYLSIYEKYFPGDDVPHRAIEVVRRLANGQAGKSEILQWYDRTLNAARRNNINDYAIMIRVRRHFSHALFDLFRDVDVDIDASFSCYKFERLLMSQFLVSFNESISYHAWLNEKEWQKLRLRAYLTGLADEGKEAA